MKNNSFLKPLVIEPPYFSNWGDLFLPKIGNKILPFIARIPGVTPNIVTITSFLIHAIGSVFLFLNFPNHFVYSAILLPISYILDCVDGQLARTKKMSSPIGDYLDKVLDVLKIYIITISLSIAAYLKTNDVLYIFLGFTACFFFNFRYYIKLETMFGAVSKDKNYLEKSRKLRYEMYEILEAKYKSLSKTLIGKLKVIWLKNRSIFFVDEAEFILFTAIGAIFNKIELVLWILAISQIYIVIFRFFERINQIRNFSDRLYWPMRK